MMSRSSILSYATPRPRYGVYAPIYTPAGPAVKARNAKGGFTKVLDLGANVDCTPEHLLQFALLGSALVAAVEGKEEPSVGLLNIGEEAIKGSETIKQAGDLLRTAGERIDRLDFDLSTLRGPGYGYRLQEIARPLPPALLRTIGLAFSLSAPHPLHALRTTERSQMHNSEPASTRATPVTMNGRRPTASTHGPTSGWPTMPRRCIRV